MIKFKSTVMAAIIFCSGQQGFCSYNSYFPNDDWNKVMFYVEQVYTNTDRVPSISQVATATNLSVQQVRTIGVAQQLEWHDFTNTLIPNSQSNASQAYASLAAHPPASLDAVEIDYLQNIGNASNKFGNLCKHNFK